MEDINNTAQQPENTQPQAVNVDIDAIVSQASSKATRQAERKMQGVFKSMLEQEGLDTETIDSVTAEWKGNKKPAERAKPKEIERAKPKESEEYRELLSRLEALEQTNTKAQAALVERQQMDYLKAQGIPENQIDFYHFKALKLIGDGITFEQAAAEYIKDNPVQLPPPEYATGKGIPVNTNMTLDDYRKLTYSERLKLKQEKPTIYAHFAKMKN